MPLGGMLKPRLCDTCCETNRQLTIQATGKFLERKEGVPQWVFEHEEMAGMGTQTLPGADALYLPLVGSRGAVGVIGVRSRSRGSAALAATDSLLETLAGLIALALEQAEAEQAEQSRVQSVRRHFRFAVKRGVARLAHAAGRHRRGEQHAGRAA